MEKAVSTIGAKEQNTIAKRSGLVFMDYDPKTEIECAELYKNAPEIAKIAEATVRDGLQGKALLNAKKIICGDEWDAPQLTHKSSQKWLSFLELLNLVDKKGSQKNKCFIPPRLCRL